VWRLPGANSASCRMAPEFLSLAEEEIYEQIVRSVAEGKSDESAITQFFRKYSAAG